MGNGFQFFDIILFAMIAAFLILRLRSVLGKRDDGADQRGHRDRFARLPDKEHPDGKVVHLPGPSEPPPQEAPAGNLDPTLAAGYEQIRAADRNFDPEEFVVGARVAFEMVLGAYAHNDAKALKPLLSPEVFANFEQAIREREELRQTLEDTLVGIKTAEIVEAWMEGRHANVTVKFTSEQVHVLRDAEGEIIEGDPNRIFEITDFWTFARNTRSHDPNWALVATRSQE